MNIFVPPPMLPPTPAQSMGGGQPFSGCPSFRDTDFVSYQYIENELMEFDQFCMCIDIDKI